MEITLPSCSSSGIDIYSKWKLSALEYADKVVLLSQHKSKLQVF